MKAEEFYKKIEPQLGTEALLSLQIDGSRLYGKDAICKMLEYYLLDELEKLKEQDTYSTDFALDLIIKELKDEKY
mgnify:CR=1 FL=1